MNVWRQPHLCREKCYNRNWNFSMNSYCSILAIHWINIALGLINMTLVSLQVLSVRTHSYTTVLLLMTKVAATFNMNAYRTVLVRCLLGSVPLYSSRCGQIVDVDAWSDQTRWTSLQQRWQRHQHREHLWKRGCYFRHREICWNSESLIVTM